MQTFKHGDLEQVWAVTSVSEDGRWVYAKKLVDGKTGRGRPSKFNRSEVESLIPGGLVVETQTELPLGEPINKTTEPEPTVEELPDVQPGEVVFVNLD